jgi:hypothetical protein
MGAKITLTGQPQDIQKQERSVSFHIITGPATRHPPRGLKLFDKARYHVECTPRQWSRAHHSPHDDSDMIVKGYIEPRRDPDTGQLYIAVVATEIESRRSYDARRRQQLQDAVDEARQAFLKAKGEDVPRQVLEERAAAFIQVSEELESFVAKHPELDARSAS